MAWPHHSLGQLDCKFICIFNRTGEKVGFISSIACNFVEISVTQMALDRLNVLYIHIHIHFLGSAHTEHDVYAFVAIKE